MNRLSNFSLLCGSAIIIVGLLLCSGCQKQNEDNDTEGALPGMLKLYSLHGSGYLPDPTTVYISYDTVERSITLKRRVEPEDGMYIQKYIYGAAGYLAAVYDMTPGVNHGKVLASFTYDGNYDL